MDFEQHLVKVENQLDRLNEKLDQLLERLSGHETELAILKDRDANRQKSIETFGKRLGDTEAKLNKMYIWLGIASGASAGVGGGLSQLFGG